ncbi:MAG TPA: Stp1/IreP family PP2C-type Ser/Thr phosphatase [Deltaproteobacteria bacterium]|nr:Stp1/IreP family PP2C-type Ser/Thr phosphatase [Deltaproteobacteria bacterium]
MRYKAEGITDTGRTRLNNEDAFLIDNETGLFLVSDGMGGHKAGEVASQLAIEVIQKFFSQNHAQNKELPENNRTGDKDQEELSPPASRLVEGIQLANKVIFRVGEEDIKYRGMGCTIVALLLVDPDRAIIANVGDSRIYLVRNATLNQLNEDHTLLNEYLKSDPDFLNRKEEYAMNHLDHILVRALGIEPYIDVDVKEMKVQKGDMFLLCSDGLTDMLSDEEIFQTVQAEKKLDKLCDKLVALANEKGGVDNITAVLVKIEES